MAKNITNLAFFKQNSFGDNLLYKELLEIFVKTTPEMVEQLQNAVKQNDLEQMGKIAHKLKSNVQSVGLNDVFLLLDDIESHKFDDLAHNNFQMALNTIVINCNIAVKEIAKEIEQA